MAALYYDEPRNILNGITVNRGQFFRVNLTTRELELYENNGRMSRVTDRVREMNMDRTGACWSNNEFGGLTRFDPASKTFTDMEVKLPGKLMDFRAFVVSSKNVLYGISSDGFVWGYDTASGKLEDYSHVIGMPNEPHYTTNIALHDDWGYLYFLAGNHGAAVYEKAIEVVTILDLKTRKYYWEGVEGCFGALVARNHAVYFNCFGRVLDGGPEHKDKNGRDITRPFLLRYDPPRNLAELNR